MKNIIVVGAGEVGVPIKTIEEEAGNTVWVREIKEGYDLPKKDTHIDVMHVCTPYIPSFCDRVVEWTKYHDPKIVIIHTTVPIGTTRLIALRVKSAIVHSPVRGVHPYLYDGIKTFKKLVGGDDISSKVACEHLKTIGIEPIHVGCSEATELGKLLSTTYYGWNILFAKQVNALCKEYNLDYNAVYTIPNETYNEGYNKLGMSHVTRPVLTPPKGKIGGHCVSQNFELLPYSKLKTLVKELNENN